MTCIEEAINIGAELCDQAQLGPKACQLDWQAVEFHLMDR